MTNRFAMKNSSGNGIEIKVNTNIYNCYYFALEVLAVAEINADEVEDNWRCVNSVTKWSSHNELEECI